MLVTVQRGARGQDSLAVQRFKQRMVDFDTLFVISPPVPELRLRHGEGQLRHVTRWDGTRGVGMIESAGGAARWVWWGGQASRDLGPGPEFPTYPTEMYGPIVDFAIAELWTEVRAGFPNTPFVWVEYSAVPSGWVRSGAYRLDLPFAWTSGWDLYLGLDDEGQPYELAVYGVVEGEWVIDPIILDVVWNVPLRDDLDQREGYRSIASVGGMLWHEEGAVHSWLELDLAASLTAEPVLRRQGQPPVAFTAVVWDEPCAAGAVAAVPVHLEWTWDAYVAKSGERALSAMNAGCTIGVRATAEMHFALSPGASATFEGLLTLTDDLGTVLASKQVASNFTAETSEPARRWSPHETMLPLPPGEHHALRLVLDGTLTHECTVAGPAENQVGISVGKPRPMLRWTGCWPDMGIVQ